MTDYPTEWTTEKPDAWGLEAKTYQTAVFDRNGNQVGDIASGILHQGGYNWASVFGLTVKYRQARKYNTPAPKKPEEKKYRLVRIERYDREGKMIDLTVETRMVYKNTKGEYIKTRSEGSPKITYVMDDGTRVIVYKPQCVRRRSWANEAIKEFWTTKPVAPEDWDGS